jgi:SAM-dependent methyltransferase
MGYGTEVLSKSARETVGVDVSGNAIAAATSRYARPSLQFRVVDGGSLPFKDHEFDLIVSCQVIEHVVDYSNYVGELKRVLLPEGFAVFTTPNAVLRLDPGMKPWNTFHVREFTAAELKSELVRFFTNVEVLGLFAREPLYSIERGRLDRARQDARRSSDKASGTAWSAWKRMPRRLSGMVLRGLGDRWHRSTIDKDFMADHGTQDFYYRNDNLDNALDFLALCSDNAEDFESARRQLTASSS